MDTLPDEILIHIFEFLSWNDAFRFGTTCQRFRGIMYDSIKSIPETAFVIAPVLERLTRLETINIERREMAHRWLKKYTHLVTLICDTAPIPPVDVLAALTKLRYIKKRGDVTADQIAYCASRYITLSVIPNPPKVTVEDPIEHNMYIDRFHDFLQSPHCEYFTGQPDFGGFGP